MSRVHGLSRDQHFVVQMRSGAPARVAGEADPLIRRHALTGHDLDAGEVTEAALDTAVVIEDDDVGSRAGRAERIPLTSRVT